MSLKDSSLRKMIQPHAWSSLLYTTEDFTQTVERCNITGDDFLRPPRWVAHQTRHSEYDNSAPQCI